MTSQELQDEKYLAQAFKRPMRHFIHDKPFYPWLPTPPQVYFNLDYKE